MLQLEFNKEQITFELRMNPNEKNNSRILERMEQVFSFSQVSNPNRNTSLGVESWEIKSYSKGRGQNLRFYVEMDEKLLPYFNLKLWLMQNCKFRSDFDYELVLIHLYFIQNNNTLTTLEKIAEELDTDEQTIKRHREKLNYKVFATKDLCQRKIYDIDGNVIPFDLYESINTSFSTAWKSVLKQYPNQTHVDLYVKRSDNYEGDWHIVACNNSDYDLIVQSLISKGYVFDSNGLLYIDKKANPYLRERTYNIHLEINGINYHYFHTLYKLTERMRTDKDFNELLNTAYEIYISSLN